MKVLYLVRHAKSSWDDSSLADFDRPLNGRGRRSAPMIGRKLAEAGVRLDHIVSSPAQRAFTTACMIAEEIGYHTDQVETDQEIYGAGVPTLLAVIQRLDPHVETAALVGHNPGMTYLANCLTGERIENLPTCGVVTVELECDRWEDVVEGSGRQIAYIFPKMFDDRS